MFKIEDFWNLFKKLNNEDVILDPNIENLLISEREKIQTFFSHVVDQHSFNTQSYQKLRRFLIDWYSSHRTIVSIEKHVNDIYFLPENHIEELIRSFGFPGNLSILNKNTKINLLFDLCNLYKTKGTPDSILKILSYYGYVVDLVEYWLTFDKDNGNLILHPEIVHPLPPKNNIGKYSDILFEELKDPHWFYNKNEILQKVRENKINLPSLIPYFGLYYNVNFDKISLGVAIILRLCQSAFYKFQTTKILPKRDIRLTYDWSYVSLLELYLACVYTFLKIFSNIPFGLPYFNKTMTSEAIYANTVSDVLIYTQRDEFKDDYDILFYRGDEIKNIPNILVEYANLTNRAKTREELKNKYEAFKSLFTIKQSEKFFGSMEDIETILIALNKNLKKNIDNIITNSFENKKFLLSLLRDISNWMKINIGYNAGHLDELLISFLQGDDIRDIINFFKPYRARLLELRQVFPFEGNEIVPEDRLDPIVVNQIFVDWDTADGLPCCGIAETCGGDSTSPTFYTRETYDCGNVYDRGASDDTKTNTAGDYGIEIPLIKEYFPDVLFCISNDTTCNLDGGYLLDTTGEIIFAYQSNGFSGYDCGNFYDCPAGNDLSYIFVED